MFNILAIQDIEALHAEIARTLGNDPDEDEIQAYLENHENRAFWSKIVGACAFARTHGYPYIWIDTCCINKMSSAELSEAVNSMYGWYAQAGACYAYLHDVPSHEYPSGERSKFRSSKWFKRGWTLQELVAPRTVVFLSVDWSVLGTKQLLAPVIEEITRISRAVLTHAQPLDSVSVAERMSWASERQTTRTEDEAYSLLGIFGIHMPTIYGEEKQAFIRLQEEILRHIPDQTLFAWGKAISFLDPSDHHRLLVSTADNHLSATPRSAYLFAPSTAEFLTTGLSPLSLQEFSMRLSVVDVRPPQYIATSYGLRARLPVVQLDIGAPGDEVGVMVALLACQDLEGSIPALVLSSRNEPNQHSVGGYNMEPISSGTSPLDYSALRPVARRGTVPRFILLHPMVLNHLWTRDPRRVARWENIYVLHRPPRNTAPSDSLRFALSSPRTPRYTPFSGSCDIVIPRYTSSFLSDVGYASTDLPITHGSPIAVRHPGQRYTVELHGNATAVPELIRIGFSLCNEDDHPRDSRPLHVAVEDWLTVRGQQPGQPSSSRLRWGGMGYPLSDCARCHVQDWENGEKTFPYDDLKKSIRLRLSDWYPERTPLSDLGLNETAPQPRAVFALDIAIIDQSSQSMGQYSPSQAASARSPVLQQQWSAAVWETPPPSYLSTRMARSEASEAVESVSSHGTPYFERLRSLSPVDPESPYNSPTYSDMTSPGPSHGFVPGHPSPEARESQFAPGIVPFNPPIRSILKTRPQHGLDTSPVSSFRPLPRPPIPSFVPSLASPESTSIPPPPSPASIIEDEDEDEGEDLFPPFRSLNNDWASTSTLTFPASVIVEGQVAHPGDTYDTERNAPRATRTVQPSAPATRPTVRTVQLDSEASALQSILSDPSYRLSRDEEARAHARDRRVRFKVEATARPAPW